ncbi:TonB-dependent receptor [Spongiibacter sp. KMU-158]|uniref:TonB-dependent receptor n=2 Tax=Spongiibacter pelagi TaxID=2760804 RepID=A0A927C045_9GAMM|nr:TonB-dependent receptor [Spongiibacter pelagi]
MGLASSALAAPVLEEVLVTATKRAESLQDVPISMIAMSGESIREMGVTRAEDFAADMPAVTMAQNPIGNFVFIRGIGTPGANQGIEQSVSIFHDGIYMGRHQLTRAPFMDLARVEVLRGPQSILFGKNTIGGAISVITADPTEEFESSITAMAGSYGEKEISAIVSGPLSDTLSGRLAVRGYQMDGYIKNVMTNEDGPERDDKTLRGKLRWDAAEDLTITAKLEHSKFDSTQQSTQLADINPYNAGAQATYDLNKALVAAATGGDGSERYDDERAVDNDGGALLFQLQPAFIGSLGFPDKEEGSTNTMDLATLIFQWSLGEHELTATTGYAHYDYRDICDCDFSALPLIQVDATEDYDQYSQEIRIASPVGQQLEYIVGAYYHSSDLVYRSGEAFGSTLAFQQLGLADPRELANLTRDYGMDQKQEMWAVFGSATWSFTDATRLTAGLRYFSEDKEVDHFLNKRMTGGWVYRAGQTVGSTAADYDAFLTSPTGSTLASNGFTYAQITEEVYDGLLGTYEHDIRDRKRDESDVNYQLTLEHDLSADTMIFATASSGTKGGGFDARFLRSDTSPFFEYEEEKAQNFEVGIKTYLFDNSMTLNATAFMVTVEDYQVSIFDGATAFFVQNAAEIEAKGLEVDLNWAATEKLRVGFAGSYLDNTYKDFPNAPCWATPASPASAVRGDCVNPGTTTAYRDASGDTNVFSPELAFNLNLNYTQPVGNSLMARFIFNANYSDEQYVSADLDPIYGYQKSFTKYDARISLGDVNEKWEVALIGKNLGDELTSTGNANDQPLVNGNGFKQTDRLRSFALQGTYRF